MMNKRSIGCALLLGVVGAETAGLRLADGQSIALEQLEEAAIRSAVERVGPAVVRIDLIGGGAAAGDLEAFGPTTGLIVTASGDVITSSFAFATQPASILVTLSDGQQYPAALVATDRSRQLALLRLEGASGLQAATVAPRNELAVGQWAIAVGRAMAAERPSVSIGVVSALSRIQGRAVQTDASISPTNYGGPLVDISGRVIGVLTPLTPDSSEGASGIDWYDSGIGFAVPLDDYQSSLTRLQSGENLHAGLVGIGFTSGNAMQSPPVIASIRPRGPAAEAGLRAGDQILALAGEKTETQAAFRRKLGRFYAGDTVKLAIQRDQSPLDIEVTLAHELEPFRHAALGIRTHSGDAEGPSSVAVAQLLPGGPADTAGIQPGDRIQQLADQQISNVEELTTAIQSQAPGEKVHLKVLRDGELQDVRVALAERSAEPYPRQAREPVGEDLPGTPQAFKLPEFASPCPIYLPSDGPSREAPGLLLVLQSEKAAVDLEILRQWQEAAEQNRLILAMPGPQEGQGWSRRDIEYVRQLLRTLIERHGVDGRRVALAGPDIPNEVTLFMWLANRELIRGVWLGSVNLPLEARLPENEPDRPCLVVASAEAPNRQSSQFIERLGERGFAGTTNSDSSPQVIAAWVDSLDRL